MKRLTPNRPILKRLIPICLLMACSILPACQVFGPDVPLDVLSKNRSTWDTWTEGTYSYRLLRGCFCVSSGMMWVQVVDHEVVYAYAEWEERPVPQDQLAYIETIEAIFDMIKRAEKEADEWNVEWADEGYPSRVSIDWIKEAIDDEMYLEVSDVVPGYAMTD